MAEAQETAMSAARNKFVDALKKRDFVAVGDMYTNDAVLLPPGASIIMGKGNIQSHWEKMSGELEGIEFEPANVAPLGSEAIREIGRFRMTKNAGQASDEDDHGSPQAQEHKYVFVWQKIGSDWKVVASSWNRMGGQNRGQGRRGGGGPGGGQGGRPGGGRQGGGRQQGGRNPGRFGGA